MLFDHPDAGPGRLEQLPFLEWQEFGRVDVHDDRVGFALLRAQGYVGQPIEEVRGELLVTPVSALKPGAQRDGRCAPWNLDYAVQQFGRQFEA